MHGRGALLAALLAWYFSSIRIVASSGSSDPALHICADSTFYSFGPGDRGTIEGPSNSLMSECTLTITTCSRCRIRLKITQLDRTRELANESTRSMANSSFLFLSEPGYPDLYRYISPSNSPMEKVHESETRVLSIRYDGPRVDYPRFSMEFETIEKNYTVKGQYPDSGEFRNLGFPNGYGPSNDTFVYHILNEDPSGFIKLTFTDWHLSRQCRIRILLSNSTIDVGGYNKRPFIMSDGPRLTVEVNFTTNVESFAGFKARYEFVRSKVWLNKPKIVEEFYYNSNFGGLLECNCPKYTIEGWADFIWVLSYSPLTNGNSSKLLLRLMQPTLSAGDELEIRRGNSSDGELMDWSRPAEYIGSYGIYIRLRMQCSIYHRFQAVFAWIQQLNYDEDDLSCVAPYNHLCEQNSYCISPSLMCDDVKHCGDGSDERSCNRFTAALPIGCYAYFRCEDSKQTICEAKRCNGRPDCDDESDEAHCGDYPVGGHEEYDPFRSYTMLATVVPVAVGSIITFVVVCAVIGFVLQRRRHRAAVNRVRQMLRESRDREIASGDVIEPVGFSDEEGDLRGVLRRPVVTGPPSYEDTLSFDTELEAVATAPPPYSAVDDESSTNKRTDSGTSCSFLPPTYDVATGEVDCVNASDRDPLLAITASDGGDVSSQTSTVARPT